MTRRVRYERYAGVYYAYPKPKERETPVPEGYNPFYLSHYGRHGSRWMSKEEHYTWIAQHFNDEQNLTDFGLQLKERLQPAFENAKGNAGKLTPLGVRQQRDIAKRMYQRIKTVFEEKDVTVSARSSVSPRCIDSMDAFVQQLRKQNPHLNITEEADERYLHYIAYTSPEEEVLERDTIVRCSVTGERLAKSLFKDTEKIREQDRLLTELHNMASTTQNIPLPYSYWDIFTEEEIKAVYDMNNTRMRLVNGIDPFNRDIPARCASSLWRNIVETADSVIAAGMKSATLRFGHDTCLYHLLSLLHFFADMPNMMDEILPMAANLQILFYRNDNGHVIVKFLHNEKELRWKDDYLSSDIVPYYDWQEVKQQFQHWLDEEQTTV
ncbi:MAG: histidine-type phosphatase [Prevotella sp.]|nr:histidine-type phosphatase [Prevotella sp.]